MGTTVRDNQADIGGGIENTGVMTITDTTISDNRARIGGGIHNNGPGSGLGGGLVIERSTISDNRAADGGGISNRGGDTEQGIVTMTNSTVSGNAAMNDGGGILNDDIGKVRLNNVTVTQNRADSDDDGSGDGGGIFNGRFDPALDQGEEVSLSNTILAENRDRGGEAPDCAGILTSLGHNILGDPTGCMFSRTPTDKIGVDSRLRSLQNNGGLTRTHALQPDSPAIDMGDNATCAPTDQRGVPRPQDGDGDGVPVCDIGAFERRPGEAIASG